MPGIAVPCGLDAEQNGAESEDRCANLDEKSRSIQVLVANVAALEHQIKELKDQLTTDGVAAGSATNMTQALLEYEGLLVERTIAEKLNESANLLLDKARVAAGKVTSVQVYARRG